MNWVITGGCGFIGVNLISKLVEDGGDKICVLDNLSVGSRSDLGSVCSFKENSPLDFAGESGLVELAVGDILDSKLALRVTKNADVIVHLAANTGVAPSVKNPRADMESNVIGTFNLLEAARQNNVKRFVFASSGAPAGEVEPPIHEEVAPHPVSPYGASKLAGEGYCSAYARTFGVETVALRFGNVYGPRSGHKSSVVAKFIQQALRNETLEVYGDGLQTRDFIFVGDIVDAIIKAAETLDIGGEVFQVATQSESTIQELLGKLFRTFDAVGLKRPEVAYSDPRLGDVRRNYSDTSKARTKLGWQAKVSLDEGLRMTVSSIKN